MDQKLKECINFYFSSTEDLIILHETEKKLLELLGKKYQK